MAGGFYTQDPQTGMPVMQTPGGQPLYLPLSQDDMALAGAQMQGPPGLPPAPDAGPDMREAKLTSQDVSRAFTPRVIQQDKPAPTASDGIPRIQLSAPGAPTFTEVEQPATQPGAPRLPTAAEQRNEAFRATLKKPTVDPSELAQHRAAPTAAAEATGDAGGRGGINDPLVRAAYEEAIRGSGGGGPRKLGVTGQTVKYKTLGAVPEAVHQRSVDATNASDAYNEQLAMSLSSRQEQAYQAQNAEYAGRVQAMAEQRAREAEQQRHLDEFEKKWDAQSAEAAQMKAPQMEQYWGSMSTMAKMATAISITLGGALQGLRGGSNPGLEMSNQAIDRWIAEQKDAYSRARDKANVMGNQYARMVQSYGSQNLAEQRLRDQAYAVRDAMMQSYAQKIGTPSALEAYNQAQLESEAQRAKLQEKAYQDAGAEIEEKLSMQGGGGGGAAGRIRKAVAAAAEVEKNRRIIAGEDKKAGTGPKPSDLKELNQSDAALAGVDKLLSGVAPGEELPGLKSHNIVSRAFRSAADTVAGEGTGSGILDTEEERGNAQRVDWMQKQIIHALTGAGMSNEERADYVQMIRGARTTQDLRNIVQTIKQQNAEQRRLIGGGAPEAEPEPAASEEEVR